MKPRPGTLTAEEHRELKQIIASPIRRLRTFYKVKHPKDGRMVPFIPTPEQAEIIEAIHVQGLTKLLILKARQLGMSTVINVIMADFMIWNEGWQGSIVDEDHKAAALKLKYKVKVAFDSMPKRIKAMFEIVNSNDSEFAMRFKKPSRDPKAKVEDQISATFAGKNARGGTNQILHVSEWGPIQHVDPPRSDEIMNGALPSAKAGIVAIETTWKGGKGGNLWNLTERAMTTRPEDMTSEDYTLFFFPWYNDPQYQVSGNFSQIPKEIHQYFEEKEKHLVAIGKPHTFTPEQRLWYYKVAMPKGNQRFAEFPTTLEECFMAPVEGAIYAALMDQARAEGRVIDFPWSREHLVYTFWDLGSPKNTRVIFVQFVGREIHIIDHDTGLDLSPTERVAHLRAKGYSYGAHLMPHDAGAVERGGKNFEDQMKDAGLSNIRIIPQCVEEWTGINKMGSLFPRIIFHKTRCKKLIASLDAYHTKEDKSNPGHQTSITVHDWSSHDADAFRYIGEAMDASLIKDGPQPAGGKVISPIDGFGDVPRRRQRVISPLD
jgi:hypothetical protein